VLLWCSGGQNNMRQEETIPFVTDSIPQKSNATGSVYKTKEMLRQETQAYFRKLEVEDSLRCLNAITFTIDENTGEVKGCPYLRLVGVYDKNQIWVEDSIKRVENKSRFKKLLPKLEKAWLGTKEIVKSDEFPDGEDRYPTNGIFSSDGNYIAVPDGMAHGGYVDKIYFFDSYGNLLRKVLLDKELSIPICNFNTEGTFFIVSDGVQGDFYFFTAEGSLVRKGDFNKWTGDNGNSYGINMISKSGKYWLLRNNESFLFSRSNELISKLLVGGNTIIDDENNRVLFTYGSSITVFNCETNKYEFKCPQWAKNTIGFFEGNYLYFNLNNKIYNYEYVK
nr:hypothetical protein [Saprospiraceae bacterium]